MGEGRVVAGKYRLNRLLGSGGMATVWAATNVFTDRRVAIKFILPQLAQTAEATQRLLREAKISARINHPNVIEVLDVGSSDDRSVFLVMELLSGMSLDLAMQRTPPLAVRDFLWVMARVARALTATHACGVIHRDLKPSNIFLHRDRNGQLVPKILDFGVSKILDPGVGTDLTVAGAILGSPSYMSPEQALGTEAIDSRTDVFSFGSILFEGLSGQRAYDGSTLNALIVAMATVAPKSLDRCAPHLPESLRKLVRDCMVTDRAARLDSFDVIAHRLEAVVETMDDSQSPLPPPRPKSASTGSFRTAPANDSAGVSTSARRITSMAPHSLPARVEPHQIIESETTNGPNRGRPSRKRVAAFVTAAALGAVAVTGSSLPHLRDVAALATNASSTHLPSTPLPSAPPAGNENATVSVPVDSLPMVGDIPPTRAGRLSVSSLHGSCAVLVDGVARGTTPLTPLVLDTGVHRLECKLPSGRSETAHLVVSEGAESHYEFALMER
jgi:serine/threonine protein kinase